MKAANRAGLSLMEVILAIAILGGSLTVVGQLVRIGARNAIEARDLATAQLYCESKLNEVAAGVEVPDSVTESPIDETGEWIYSINVGTSELEGMLAVNVTVSQDPKVFSRPLSTTLTRWIVDPEYAQTAADEEAAIKQAFADAQAIATGPMSGTTKGQVAMAGGGGAASSGQGGSSQGSAQGGRRREGGGKDGGGKDGRGGGKPGDDKGKKPGDNDDKKVPSDDKTKPKTKPVDPTKPPTPPIKPTKPPTPPVDPTKQK